MLQLFRKKSERLSDFMAEANDIAKRAQLSKNGAFPAALIGWSAFEKGQVTQISDTWDVRSDDHCDTVQNVWYLLRQNVMVMTESRTAGKWYGNDIVKPDDEPYREAASVVDFSTGKLFSVQHDGDGMGLIVNETALGKKAFHDWDISRGYMAGLRERNVVRHLRLKNQDGYVFAQMPELYPVRQLNQIG